MKHPDLVKFIEEGCHSREETATMSYKQANEGNLDKIARRNMPVSYLYLKKALILKSQHCRRLAKHEEGIKRPLKLPHFLLLVSGC